MRRRSKHRYNASIFHPSVPKYRTTYNQKKGLVLRQRPREENKIRKTDADYAEEIEWLKRNNLIQMPITDQIIEISEITIRQMFPMPDPPVGSDSSFGPEELFDLCIRSTRLDEKIPSNYSLEFHLMDIFMVIRPHTQPFTNFDAGEFFLVNSGGWLSQGALKMYDTTGIEDFPSSDKLYENYIQDSKRDEICVLSWTKVQDSNNLDATKVYSNVNTYVPIGTASAGILPLISTGTDLTRLPSLSFMYIYNRYQDTDCWNWTFKFKILVHVVKDD